MWYASECTANWEAYAFLFAVFSFVFLCCFCTHPLISIPMNHIGFEWDEIRTHSAISASQRDETIIILLMGISDRSISHFKRLATNAKNIMLLLWWRQRIAKQSDECVWFRTMLYCSHGIFFRSEQLLPWIYVVLASILCDQKPNEEINCRYNIIYWVHWILFFVFLVTILAPYKSIE